MTWTRRRILIAVGGILMLLLIWIVPRVAPPWLARMQFFRVQRVVVVGLQYAAPHQVLEASGIDKVHSVWDDWSAVERAIGRNVLVRGVRIRRQLPSTLVVEIVEREPVVLVAIPALIPVSSDGFVLPLDPGEVQMDLPVVTETTISVVNGHVTDSTSLALFHMLGRIDSVAPRFLARVSDLSRSPDGTVRAVLEAPRGTVVLFPMDLDPARVAEFEAVLGDLIARDSAGAASASNGGLKAEIDLRFRGQIVVRPAPQ